MCQCEMTVHATPSSSKSKNFAFSVLFYSYIFRTYKVAKMSIFQENLIQIES